MLRGLYDWTLRMAGHRRAVPALGAVSFVESSVFPIPPDIMLIPMILADRRKAWMIAAVCSVTSVLGGAFGYLLGYAFWETIGQPIINFYGYGEHFEHFAEKYNEYGGWFVFTAGVSPLPYKVFTIASGVTQLDFMTFFIASAISRSIRFYAIAALLFFYGEPIKGFIERNMGWLSILFVVLLFAGFVVIKFVI